MTDTDAVAALAQDTARALGPIGILVTSAGIAGSNGKVVDYAPAEWRQIVEINLTGTFNCCRAVLPQMQAQSYGASSRSPRLPARKAIPMPQPILPPKPG